MGQNLKETLLLGNITCSETWKENIQGVFGFIGDKVVFCSKKVKYFSYTLKFIMGNNNIHSKRFIAKTYLHKKENPGRIL